MARRSSNADNAESTGTSNELISNLIEGSEFKFIEGRVGSLSDKPKVETPIIALNDLLGGGLPLGAILEVYGPNASGKSSLMYETLGNFQRQYPNGVAFIIDTETSTDDSRLRQLGVDPSRAPRMGASTLEDGFEQMIKIMRKMVDDERYKGFPVFILWDTLGAAGSRSQIDSGDMYSKGMAEKARIIKSSLTAIFPLIEKLDVIVVLLNQVMAEIGGWRPGITSSGGHALRHDVHIRLEINGGKTSYDGIYPVSKYSELSINKSKISPIINKFPVQIDITKGGVVDRNLSFIWWITNLTEPTVFSTGSWWKVSEWCYNKYRPYWDKLPKFAGKFRQSELYEVGSKDENLIDLLRLIWIDLVSDKYALQREVVRGLRTKVEANLMSNLGLTYDQVYHNEIVSEQAVTDNPGDTVITSDDISSIISHLEIDESTGEVIE